MAHDSDAVVVTVHDLRLPCKLGWGDEERARTQVVAVNLELRLSVPGVQESDNLKDSVDYREIVQRLERIASQREWRLLEKMTFDLASDLLTQFPLVQKVDIAIRKNVFPGAQGVTVARTLARYN